MKKKSNSRSRYDLILSALLIASVALLVTNPVSAVEAAREGGKLSLTVLAPTLFPYFVVSNMIVNSGLAECWGSVLDPIMRPLFNVNGACSAALILGFVGGYPVGAKTIVELYSNGVCSKTEAERLLSFCNNSGPAFILGVVGAVVFEDMKVGLLLYAIHIVSSILIGVIFRFWGKSETETVPNIKKKKTSENGAIVFTKAVTSALGSCLGICGFVMLFSVISELIRNICIDPFILKLPYFIADWIRDIVSGVLEMSSGILSLKKYGASGRTAVMASFMLGWAGLSVHFQTMSVISEYGLSARTHVIGKLLHGIVASALTLLVWKLCGIYEPVSFFVGVTGDGIKTLNLYSLILTACCTAGGILALFKSKKKKAAE